MTQEERTAAMTALLRRPEGASIRELMEALDLTLIAVWHRLNRQRRKGKATLIGGKGDKNARWYASATAPDPGQKLAEDLAKRRAVAEERKAKILALCSRANGANHAELMAELDCSVSCLQKTTRAMRKDGVIELSGLPGNIYARWYAAGKVPPEQAAKHRAAKERALQTKRPAMLEKQRAVLVSGPVIVPENVKRTVGKPWTHDVRYQLPPGTRVVGGFASMGVGRYL